MVNRCPNCGKDMDLVGRRHNCSGPTTLADVRASAEVEKKARTIVAIKKKSAPGTTRAKSGDAKVKIDQSPMTFDEATQKLTGGRAGRRATPEKVVMTLSVAPVLKRRLRLYAIHHNETVSAAAARILNDRLDTEGWEK